MQPKYAYNFLGTEYFDLAVANLIQVNIINPHVLNDLISKFQRLGDIGTTLYSYMKCCKSYDDSVDVFFHHFEIKMYSSLMKCMLLFLRHEYSS